jgi:acyl transferase domain-containing protein
VLKRLSHAVAEGDRILGVIRGSEVNQCGEAKSITHPDHETQASLFRKLFQRVGMHPNSVNVVEAHGTG